MSPSLRAQLEEAAYIAMDAVEHIVAALDRLDEIQSGGPIVLSREVHELTPPCVDPYRAETVEA